MPTYHDDDSLFRPHSTLFGYWVVPKRRGHSYAIYSYLQLIMSRARESLMAEIPMSENIAQNLLL